MSSLSKAAQVELVQNEIAKASKALVDAETHVESLKASIAAQTRLLDALMAECGEKACTETIRIDILPILTLKMPPMRPDSKLYKGKFQVTVSSNVVREFMDYCKVPAERMLVYGSPTIQSVELEDVFQCFAAGVSRWPSPLLHSIKERLEEEAFEFFESHEILPAGSVFPAPFFTKDAPVKNRSMVLSAWCWVYVPKCE